MSEVPKDASREAADSDARHEREEIQLSEADTRQGPKAGPEADAGTDSPFHLGSTHRIPSRIVQSTPGAAPRRFGKYDLIGKIGSGGFGVVLRGRDPHLQRDVAIKISTTENAELSKRFLREAKIAARFQHPNIVTIFDFGYENGVPFMVQELLDGEDLAAVLAREDALPVARQIDVLLQVARGMAYAHAQGVLHRDIKPPNVRLLSDGQVKILDFGIARLVDQTSQLTATDMKIGTAAYMAPEQLSGGQAGPPSDIFAFGVLAYEVVAGKHPFAADTISRAFFRILNEAPTTLSELVPACPSHLAELIDRCLAKDPADRPASFEAIVNQLEQPADSATTSSVSASGLAPAPTASGQETPLAAATDPGAPRHRMGRAAVGIAVVLPAGFAWYTQRPASEPQSSAQEPAGPAESTRETEQPPPMGAESTTNPASNPRQPANDTLDSSRQDRAASIQERTTTESSSAAEEPDRTVSLVKAQGESPNGNDAEPQGPAGEGTAREGTAGEEADQRAPGREGADRRDAAQLDTDQQAPEDSRAKRAQEPEAPDPAQAGEAQPRVTTETTPPAGTRPDAETEADKETATPSSTTQASEPTSRPDPEVPTGAEASEPATGSPSEQAGTPLFRAGEVGVRPPAATERPTPDYPSRAQRRGKEAVVEVAVLVDEHGKVLQSFVRSCSTPGLGFEEAALAAADRTIFQPARRGIQTGRMWTQLTFRFERRR